MPPPATPAAEADRPSTADGNRKAVEDPAKSCRICFDRPRSVRLLPCRHAAMCVPCAMSWCKTGEVPAGKDPAFEFLRCPTGRCKVERVLLVPVVTLGTTGVRTLEEYGPEEPDGLRIQHMVPFLKFCEREVGHQAHVTQINAMIDDSVRGEEAIQRSIRDIGNLARGIQMSTGGRDDAGGGRGVRPQLVEARHAGGRGIFIRTAWGRARDGRSVLLTPREAENRRAAGAGW